MSGNVSPGRALPYGCIPFCRLFCTRGRAPWGSNETILDLLGEPEAFHAFAPTWKPLFWNLADQSPESLLQSGLEWLQALAVIRAQNLDAAGFEAVYSEALRCLERVAAQDEPRWYDLLRIVLTWAYWRRPGGERDHRLALAPSTQS